MKKRPRDLARFASDFKRQYGRKAHAGHDPNDRAYDRHLESLLKRLPADDLERVLEADVEPTDPPRGRRRCDPPVRF